MDRERDELRKKLLSIMEDVQFFRNMAIKQLQEKFPDIAEKFSKSERDLDEEFDDGEGPYTTVEMLRYNELPYLEDGDIFFSIKLQFYLEAVPIDIVEDLYRLGTVELSGEGVYHKAGEPVADIIYKRNFSVDALDVIMGKNGVVYPYVKEMKMGTEEIDYDW